MARRARDGPLPPSGRPTRRGRLMRSWVRVIRGEQRATRPTDRGLALGHRRMVVAPEDEVLDGGRSWVARGGGAPPDRRRQACTAFGAVLPTYRRASPLEITQRRRASSRGSADSRMSPLPRSGTPGSAISPRWCTRFSRRALTVPRHADWSGLVLVLDEVETLQRVRSDARAPRRGGTPRAPPCRSLLPWGCLGAGYGGRALQPTSRIVARYRRTILCPWP